MSGSAFTRRKTLALAAAALCTPHVALARPGDGRTLSLRHAQTDERFDETYFADGLYEPDATAQLDRLFRDFHAEESIEIDVRLYDLLARLQEKHGRGAEPIVITSAYRTRETNERLRRRNRWASANSLHVPGMAADLRIPGVPNARLVRTARGLGMGGVGAYDGASFIHVDVGAVRFWRR